jgi:hypothetical protein
MTSDGLRLLQDLRGSLLDPPRQLRLHTAATARPAPAAPELSARSPSLITNP